MAILQQFPDIPETPPVVVPTAPEPEYRKLTDKEWYGISKRALENWKAKHLKERPTYKTVKKTTPGLYYISSVVWLGFLVAFILVTYGSVKQGLSALPFATSMVAALAHNEGVSPEFLSAVKVLTVVTFVGFGGFSLIFFQILSYDPRVLADQRRTEKISHEWSQTFKIWKWEYTLSIDFKWLDLDYLTPRIPGIMVYLVTLWVIWTSLSVPGNILERFLPVLGELGLVHLLTGVLDGLASNRQTIEYKLAPLQEAWDKRLESYNTDTTYYDELYPLIRYMLLTLKRDGKRVNQHLEFLPDDGLDVIIDTELGRLSGNVGFSQRAVKIINERNSVLMGETLAPVTLQRVPPNNKPQWTPQDLFNELKAMNVPADYNEAQLAKDFAPDYEARKAWRGTPASGIVGAGEMYRNWKA